MQRVEIGRLLRQHRIVEPLRFVQLARLLRALRATNEARHVWRHKQLRVPSGMASPTARAETVNERYADVVNKALKSPAGGLTAIDFAFSDLQLSLRAAVEKICARFGDDYWLEHDRDGGFPEDFSRAIADAGWLGIACRQSLRRRGPRHHRSRADDADHQRVGRRLVGRLRACT